MSQNFSKLSLLGRHFFGTGIAASGVMQLIRGDFVRLVPKIPSATPAHVRLVGVVLVLAGAMIALGKWTRTSAIAVGVLLMAVLYAHVPAVVSNPRAVFMWLAPGKALALLGGAILLAASGLPEPVRLRLCRVFLAQFLILAGIAHFVYAGSVHAMIPAWMPVPPFWTYFTAVALLAGGVGLLRQRTAGLAGALSGLMIFLWVLLLHIPRALAVPHVAGETDGVCEALALSGLAWLAAGGAGPSSKSSSQK